MLETVREYALEHLAEDDAQDDVRRRHARAYAALAESADEGLHSRETGAWLERVHADRENIRAAMGFAAAEGDSATALQLCTSWRYWVLRGNLTEGRALVNLALASGDGPPELRWRAINAAGVLASEQGDFEEARVLFEECLGLAEQLGSPAQIARVSGNLAIVALYERDFDEAIRRHAQSLEYWRDARDVAMHSLAAQNLGIAYSGAGQHERAIELLEESVVLARQAGDPAHLSSTMRSLSRALLVGRSDDSQALELIQDSLALAREIADRPGMVECMETLAAVAGRQGEPHAGALLIGAAAAARAAAGAARQPDEDDWVREVEAELRDALGAEAFAAAVAEGGRLDLREAVDRAVAV
jgi:tetratricopeptide (TPR) repeat protein